MPQALKLSVKLQHTCLTSFTTTTSSQKFDRKSIKNCQDCCIQRALYKEILAITSDINSCMHVKSKQGT